MKPKKKKKIIAKAKATSGGRTAKKKSAARKKKNSPKESSRKKFLAKILDEMKEERAYLQERIASAKRDEWMGSVNDEIDTAVASAERDILFERVDRFVQRLDEIENALRKAKKGKFGICERCGGEISIRRLKLIPYARYCFKCMSQID
ncbi:MAG: TraR/DksA C4-type zinc finger protein [Elusimicrobia bacterium]|nr:TraR/DksA C4-type zinc finger protein [Elusimicrobiota bacterium]